jgi:hypothetical protein
MDPGRYLRFFGPAMAAARAGQGYVACGVPASPGVGGGCEGKAPVRGFDWSKASATFAGGAEYLAWKINRHAGTKIELSEWQKKHPLATAVMLLPRLLRSKAIR